jgi:2',3'-cyclic-nucleotide 2'-phosphodiesterase (5'-nucleotidase family)
MKRTALTLLLIVGLVASVFAAGIAEDMGAVQTSAPAETPVDTGTTAPAETPADTTAPAETQSTAPATTTETTDVATAESTATAEGVTKIRVFETTDIHGYLLDTSSGDESTFQYRLAYIANAVNEARKAEEYDGVLLLNGGNNYEGTPVSNLLQGSAVKAAMDVMDYDAVSIGNHEFDYGITNNCDDDGTLSAYSIGNFTGDSDTPVLAYNLYYAGTKDRVSFAKDYVVVEKGGKRVALIGYISDFSSQVMTSKISAYEIDDSIDALIAKIKEVNAAENPDVTVVVSFSGASSLAEKLSKEDVDLVTGGHNQASNGSAGISSTGVAYLESACYAQGYVYATIVVDNATGEVSVEDLGAKALTGRGADTSVLYDTADNTSLDPIVLEISHEAWDAVKDNMQEELGYITVSIDKTTTSDNGATYAGNWITGLMLRYASEKCGAVAAFYNNGGIRTTLKIADGETTRTITAGDIYQINPFCNSWYIYEVTGAELAQQLINGFTNMGNYGDQMSGLTFTYTQKEVASSSSNGSGSQGGAGSQGSGSGAPAGDGKGAGGAGGPAGGPGGGSRKSYEYTITSITLSDGTVVDVNDTETTYLVCTSSYSGTLAGGVFENKTPVYPITEAPVDNVTIIELLREEAAANNGLISVDTSARGTLVTE